MVELIRPAGKFSPNQWYFSPRVKVSENLYSQKAVAKNSEFGGRVGGGGGGEGRGEGEGEWSGEGGGEGEEELCPLKDVPNKNPLAFFTKMIISF